MEGFILISLISYIDMTLLIVYMYKGPTENSHGKFGSLVKYYYYYGKHYYYYYYYYYYYH